MIQVNKPTPPASLAAGVVLTEQNCTAFDRNENDYLNGTKRFQFKQRVYGHKAVKNLLKKAQHGKCCFCEGRFQEPLNNSGIEMETFQMQLMGMS